MRAASAGPKPSVNQSRQLHARMEPSSAAPASGTGRTATRKKQHGETCNKVLALGKIIKTEKPSYKAFQKNFGRSAAVRAPGMFVDQLTRKAENAGGSVEKQNTRATKLSPTCI